MVSRIKRYKLEADLRFRCETSHGMSPKESSVAFASSLPSSLFHADGT